MLACYGFSLFRNYLQASAIKKGNPFASLPLDIQIDLG